MSLPNEDLDAFMYVKCFIYIGVAKPDIGAGKTLRAWGYYLRSKWNTVSYHHVDSLVYAYQFRSLFLFR